jgi:8-oxo-dGTP pyrophosphatase MutT (NUDIX family)
MLVLRDGARGMQLLLMRRPDRDNDFRSGACVFPGGVLDPSDAGAQRFCFGLDDTCASARLGLPGGGLDYFVAALRECFEEVGLLFVCAVDGTAVDLRTHAEALHAWRSRLHRGEAHIAQLCAAFDWRLDLRHMAYFAHWLTPVTRPKRFDTRFFVRLAPPGQDARPDYGEALELMWLSPAEALEPQRGLKLLNVTQRVLHQLRGFAIARVAYAHALALRGVSRILPRPALGRNGARFVIQGDPAYEEVAHLDPQGRGDTRCELDPGDVVQLSPRLWRVTGAAGNAYLVVDTSRTKAALIDADVDDAAQLQALQTLAVASVSWLLFTRAGDAPAAALQAHWPVAQPVGLALAGRPLELGTDSTLRCVPGRDGALSYLLEEEHVTVGELAPAHPACTVGGIDWLAPRQGFMRRSATGQTRST